MNHRGGDGPFLQPFDKAAALPHGMERQGQGSWKAQKLQAGLLLVTAQRGKVLAVKSPRWWRRFAFLSGLSLPSPLRVWLLGAVGNAIIHPVQRQLVANFEFSFGASYRFFCSQCSFTLVTRESRGTQGKCGSPGGRPGGRGAAISSQPPPFPQGSPN